MRCRSKTKRTRRASLLVYILKLLIRLTWRLLMLLFRLFWRFRKALMVVGILTTMIFEKSSPAYWLSEAIYYEARDESFVGRLGVTNVILNRVGHRRFPNSVRGVIDGGRNRGRSCEFSYRCDGKLENPWLHDRRYWLMWLQIRVEGWLVYGFHSAGILYDITDGAVFYKRKDVYSPWFTEEIQAGRMIRVEGNFGAHEYFRLAK